MPWPGWVLQPSGSRSLICFASGVRAILRSSCSRLCPGPPAALKALAEATGATATAAPRQPRANAAAPKGELNAEAIGQTPCMLMPDNAILVDEGATNGPAIFEATKGARAHDYLNPVNGGAIGGGLPMALGAAIACPDRKVVHLQADGSGMYTVQALWTMARELSQAMFYAARARHSANAAVRLCL